MLLDLENGVEEDWAENKPSSQHKQITINKIQKENIHEYVYLRPQIKTSERNRDIELERTRLSCGCVRKTLAHTVK